MSHLPAVSRPVCYLSTRLAVAHIQRSDVAAYSNSCPATAHLEGSKVLLPAFVAQITDHGEVHRFPPFSMSTHVHLLFIAWGSVEETFAPVQLSGGWQEPTSTGGESFGPPGRLERRVHRSEGCSLPGPRQSRF
jgi:hypothetical protein